MQKRLLLVTFFLVVSTPIRAETTKLNASEKWESIYFRDQERFKHNQLTLGLRQEYEFTDNLTSVIDGRVRYDSALADCKSCPQRSMPKAVREDELFEADLRELHLTYLADRYRLRLGRQKLDWVETLSPQSADFLTALDLRRGGYGELGDLIIPTEAIDFTHSLWTGAKLEWVVARPVVSRLPKGANGYGFYEYLEEQLDQREIVTDDNKIPANSKHLEAGLRLQLSASKIDFSLFGYRGHARLPDLKIKPILSDTQSQVAFHYPIVTTFGSFVSATLTDATVLRFFALYEPHREATLAITLPSGKTAYEDDTRRYRVGMGLDQVVTDDLKFYSEWYATRVESIKEGTLKDISDENAEQKNYAMSYRVSYDVTTKSQFLLDGMVTGPEKSYLVAPQASFLVFDSYRLAAGMRYVKSLSDESQLDILRETSHYFLSIENTTDLAHFLNRK